MKVRIKRIDPSLPLPKYETLGAVAFDFIARARTVIEPTSAGRVPANVVVEVPAGHMLWVTDRSSTLGKKGLLITEGIIDQDYAGDTDEILLQFYNPTDKPVIIDRGERLAQGLFLPVDRAEWQEVESMGRESRGGFGTTGSLLTYKPELEAISPISPIRPTTPTKGKLIVLYGINNLGKSTQAKMLVERLRENGRPAEYIKYHVYDLEPTGSMINEYIRLGNPYGLNEREFQLLATINKYHNQPNIESLLARGVTVVLEDYWATSIAWGSGNGVDKGFLTRLNEGIIREDIAFLFDGERFLESREVGHQFESDDDRTWRARVAHRELAEGHGWIMINANQPVDAIHEFIWEYAWAMLKLKV